MDHGDRYAGVGWRLLFSALARGTSPIRVGQLDLVDRYGELIDYLGAVCVYAACAIGTHGRTAPRLCEESIEGGGDTHQSWVLYREL
ncbi:MAG TPA: hypothetical protein PLK40_05690 [Bacteroidaceae bacterium]|nr:hypothetical protein [Bacteroidaceae bacterium]